MQLPVSQQGCSTGPTAVHNPPHTHPPLLHTHRLMTQAVEHLRHELAGVRTGRANPGLLENITVNIAGSSLPLKACGAVTVRNPQLLAVSVYSPEVSNRGIYAGCVVLRHSLHCLGARCKLMMLASASK